MKFLLLTTGGTIVSSHTEQGFLPTLSGQDLMKLSRDLADFEHEIEIIDLMSKDSSNMTPEDWFRMTEEIRARSALYDAIVILHGTDTMAWTSSALSYLLNDIPIPVVLTGAMISPDESDSDVSDNIFSALQFAMQLAMFHRSGVAVAFADELIHGPRVAKIDSRRKHAFVSVEYPLLGEMKARENYKIPWLSKQVPQLSRMRPWSSSLPQLDRAISLVPVFPGMPAKTLDAILESGPHAVVLEGFGLGNVPETQDGFLDAVARGINDGVSFIIRGQTVFGGADPEVYGVGRKAIELGAISAHDMTREALIVKLMLLLPICDSRDTLYSRLLMNMCDEVGY